MTTSAPTNQRKILIGMDGSVHSEYAFEWYAKNFRRPDDHVILVQCLERHGALHGAVGTADINAVCNMLEEEESQNKKLVDHLKSLLAAKELKGEVKPMVGKPGEVISHLAVEEDVTTIICGSRGKGTLRRTFMGSVSDYIVHHSHVPVIVCRHKSHHHHHHHDGGHHDKHHH